MRKTARPSEIGNILHRGFVWTCLGITAYGFVIGGDRLYHYWTVTRPAREAAKQKLIKADEEELNS